MLLPDAPPVLNLEAIADSDVPTVNLTWTIPCRDMPPDEYSLTYMATKLAGVPLSEEDRTMVVEFFDNETVSFDDVNRSYVLSSLLFYSHYQFMLVAVYGVENSTAVSANASMTAEGGKLHYHKLIVCCMCVCVCVKEGVSECTCWGRGGK